MLISDLREQLARYLADYDSSDEDESFRTWSKEDIDHAIRLACIAVFAARPGRFAKRVLITPRDGLVQAQTDECTDVLQVIGIQWADGTTTANIRKVKQARDHVPTTSRPACVASGEGMATKTTTVNVSPIYGADGLFNVEPPLPDGASIVAVCAVSPPLKDGVLDVPDTFYPVVFEWALAHLFGTEIESTTAGGHSDRHWNRGAEVLGLSRAEAVAMRQRRQGVQQ